MNLYYIKFNKYDFNCYVVAENFGEAEKKAKNTTNDKYIYIENIKLEQIDVSFTDK